MQVQSGPLGVSASLSFAPYVPDLPYPCPNPAVQFLQEACCGAADKLLSFPGPLLIKSLDSLSVVVSVAL